MAGALQLVAARDLSADAVDVLVDDRANLAQFAGGRVHEQIAPRVQLEAVRTLEREHDRVRVGAGRQHEVVFELSLEGSPNQLLRCRSSIETTMN